MGEAEQILRRELPPEQAEQSLQWLQARNSADGAAASGGTTPDTARTWSALQGG